MEEWIHRSLSLPVDILLAVALLGVQGLQEVSSIPRGNLFIVLQIILEREVLVNSSLEDVAFPGIPVNFMVTYPDDIATRPGLAPP